MPHERRAVILSALGIAVLAALAYVSFRTDPVPVDLATVTSEHLEVTINADGETAVRDLYEVSSPITGRTLRSPVSVGDLVVKGETVVAIVEPASSGLLDARTRLQAEAALQEARAARNVALADLHRAEEVQKFAQSQFDRTKALVGRGVASTTRLEDDIQKLAIANASVEAATAQINMADGTIERAEAALTESIDSASDPSQCCVRIRAPADGVVLSIDQISGRPVTAGDALLSLGDPADLELKADILSTDGVRLTPGTKAYVERWGGDGVLLAELDRIDPSAQTKVSALGIEEQRVDAYFDLLTPVEDRSALGDGFAVFLRIVEWEAEDVIQIPLSAVFRNGSDWAVFVAGDGYVSLRPVVLGQRSEQIAQVLEGLTVGERVVTHPSDALEDGARYVERAALKG